MTATLISGQDNAKTTTKMSVIEAKKILHTLAYYFELDGIIPELRLSSQLQQPAMYTNYQKPIITLDKKMLQISDSFGKNAPVVLAFVLGHEMAHHYLKHTPGDMSDLKTYEKDADRWGCFYSHVAGYKITPALYTRLLDKVYEVYQLSDNIPHYPKKAARKKMGLQKIQEIQDFNLAEVFNTAKFLFAMGKTDQSIACLEFIFNKHFKSAEVCNNLAVAYLRKITQAKPLYQRIFLFPFEFDGNTSLRSENSGSANLPRLYEKSEILLRKAISLKKEYASAHLNLACLQILKKKYGSAIENLLELQNKAGKLSSQASNLLALAYALKNESAKAEQYFKMATADKGNYIARCNYQIYNTLVKSNPELDFSKVIASLKSYEVADMIEGVQKKCICNGSKPDRLNLSRAVFPAQSNLDFAKTVINMQPYFEVKPATKLLPSGYRLVKIKLEEINQEAGEKHTEMIKYEVCFSSLQNQRIQGLAIRSGDAVEKLLSQNTPPTRMLGNFYLYENLHLIVETWQNSVIGWMIYRKIE
ncbi:MAG TPA: hypothetical protein DCS93_01190 [Microscillaceae bacterium]|nr:hypothetical protein [Microscillaceae bacterium]